MAIRLATTTRNAMLNGPGLLAMIDADAGPGTLKVYTGAQPITADSPATGTLLVTITLNDPAFGAATGGVATLDNTPTPTGTGAANGTAGWCRLTDSSGDTVLDGSVSAAGGGGDFQMINTTVSVGVDKSVESGIITMPAS